MTKEEYIKKHFIIDEHGVVKVEATRLSGKAFTNITLDDLEDLWEAAQSVQAQKHIDEVCRWT